jgi:hypothetical protein
MLFVLFLFAYVQWFLSLPISMNNKVVCEKNEILCAFSVGKQSVEMEHNLLST